MSKSLLLKEFVDQGLPGPEHFEVVENPAPVLGDSGILVQLLVISPDPYMRMQVSSRGGKKPGMPVTGYVGGKVLESRTPKWEKGDLFGASLPFTTIQVVTEEELAKTVIWKLTGFITEAQISLGVGVLGMPGSTAYGGLIDVLRPQAEQVIFVSAASGAVGSLVGQLAKRIFGCTVIGSAGGNEKCKLITEKMGYDKSIDYKTIPDAECLSKELRTLSPEGIDMYFENVGGMHFDAALSTMKPGGRVAICGFISGYNGGSMTANLNVRQIIYYGIRVEGFVCTPWLSGKQGNFLKDMAGWWKEGKLYIQETFFDGIEQWPIAFQSLFTGANIGKVVVRV